MSCLVRPPNRTTGSFLALDMTVFQLNSEILFTESEVSATEMHTSLRKFKFPSVGPILRPMSQILR
jgi:hypothetical protein